MKCVEIGWVMDVDDFFELYRHYHKNVTILCDIVYSADVPSNLHKNLHKLNFFVKYIREKNLCEDTFVSQIHVKECNHPFCFGWCFEIYDTKQT